MQEMIREEILRENQTQHGRSKQRLKDTHNYDELVNQTWPLEPASVLTMYQNVLTLKKFSRMGLELSSASASRSKARREKSAKLGRLITKYEMRTQPVTTMCRMLRTVKVARTALALYA